MSIRVMPSRRRASVALLFAVALAALAGMAHVLLSSFGEGVNVPSTTGALFEDDLHRTLGALSGSGHGPRRAPPTDGMRLAQATMEPECPMPTADPACQPPPTEDPACQPPPTADPACMPTQDAGCMATMDPACVPTMDPACVPPTQDAGCMATMDPACMPTQDAGCVPPTQDPGCPAVPVLVEHVYPTDGATVSGAGIPQHVMISILEGGPPAWVTEIRYYCDGELQYTNTSPYMSTPGDYYEMGAGLWAHPLATPSTHGFSVEVDWERSWMFGGDSGTASDAIQFTVDNTPTISGVEVEPAGEVSGTVTLRATAKPAGDPGAMMMMSDYIDRVEFYAGGAKVGEVAGESATPVDPPEFMMGPQYVESVYTVSWNSAECDENGDPKWADGDCEVYAIAIAGGSTAQTDPVTVTVHNKGSVSGAVREAFGALLLGVEGATVTASRGGGVKGSATTDQNGHYTLELYPGAYQLKAEHTNFVTQTKGVCLAPKEAKVDVDFLLERRIQVSLPQFWSVVDPWLPAPDNVRSGEGIPADGETETSCSVTVKTQEGALVADGTVVTFSTDQGGFDPATAPTAGGSASSSLQSPELATDTGGEVTVTADGAEAKVDVKWVGVKKEVDIPDQGIIGGDFDYQATISYSRCCYVRSIRAMLARHGVWTPLGVWRLVSYAIGPDQSITATFAFTIHSYSYPNRLYPIWIWFEVLSAGGTLLTGGGTPPDIPPNPPGGAGGDATDDGFVVGGQMGNLVVSDSSGHPDNDYVCLDPDGAPPLQSAQVTFEIEDLGDPHEYRWTVFFSSTGIEGDWQASVSGTAEEPGDVTATWDGTDAVGNPMPWGVYTFDVFVQEVADCSIPEAPAIDSAWLKGPYRLTLGDHSFDFVEQEDGTTDAVVSYTLNDTSGTPATELLIDLVSPSLTSDTYYTATNVAVGEASGELVIHTFPADEPPEAGIWRAVFCAEDGHGDVERDCKNNRMLARNGPRASSRGMEIWYHYNPGDPGDQCSLHWDDCQLHWDAICETFWKGDQANVGCFWHRAPLDFRSGVLGGGYLTAAQRDACKYTRNITTVIQQGDATFGPQWAARTITGLGYGTRKNPDRIWFSKDIINGERGDATAKWGRTNVVLHELGHAGGTRHCTCLDCVMQGSLCEWFYSQHQRPFEDGVHTDAADARKEVHHYEDIRKHTGG